MNVSCFSMKNLTEPIGNLCAETTVKGDVCDDYKINKLKAHQTDFNNKFVDFAGVNDAYNLIFKTLEEMPHWISVEEKSPKKRDGYYVTLEGIGELEGVTETTTATWIDGWLYSHVDDWKLKKVTAWMPLPKPYRKTDSHNKEQKATDKVKAVIPVEVPKYQIGQEVSIYFKDTMYIKGICQETDE